jgi:integrase
MKKSNGSGTIYRRGEIWWVKIHVDGRPVYESSKSTRYTDAVKLRDRLISKKVRGEVTGGSPDKVLLGELLDDVLKSDIAESTRKLWKLSIEKSIRPFFGDTRAARLTTSLLEEYRAKRLKDGVKDATANRELTILRRALNLGRKRTPAKVLVVPYFPMVQETTVRAGFLADDVYTKLRDALPLELRPLFVVAYNTGIRKGELLAVKWDRVDFEAATISLNAADTKARTARTVPILDGDMRTLLEQAKALRDEHYPDSAWVFNRNGKHILNIRKAWDIAVKEAGVPGLTFHDLRRTAVRNMRRAGVPQVIRMAISGHKTDSMERRYNIVDGEDIAVAKKFMEARAALLTM